MKQDNGPPTKAVWAEALSKAQAVKVRNVMNPLLWLNAAVVPPLLIAAVAMRENQFVSIVLFLVAIIIPLFTLKEYSFFARTDPGRLQSEDFILEQQRLMIQSKSSSVAIDPSILPMSSNPEMLQLSDGPLNQITGQNPNPNVEGV